ncbi:orexin receptor type 2-like [Mytilus edulis]|uniref:orexin receptor type 2-like n=1 Tax=Mytilus edulis TaxID=6550 RepID=UPI0039F114F4
MDVEAWNSDLMEDMLPKTIFLICCMVIGLFGNGFTLLIYCVKMKMSDERYFIPVLATVDLFAATICPILGVMESRMIVTFNNASVCKIFWAAASFLTLMSVFVLAVIAIQRYLKVCGSVGSTMNIFWRRISLMICIVLSAAFAAPMIILHSAVEITNVEKNLTGFQCARTNEEDETVVIIYGVILVLTILIIMTLLVVIYSKIALKLYRHYKSIEKHGNSMWIRQSDDHEMHTSDTLVTGSSDEHGSSKDYGLQEKEFKPQKIPKTKVDKDSKKTNITHKLTTMFMVITMFFILCYVPKVILLVMEGLYDGFWENMSDNLRHVLTLVNEIYIINNIINPFIYAFMDSRFQNESKNLFHCIKI